MKDIRIAAYLLILIHFLRETRRKLLRPSRKSNMGVFPDPWIVYFDFPSYSMPVAICNDRNTAIRMKNNTLIEYCTKNTLLNNHMRICIHRSEPGALSDKELGLLDKYVIFLYIYNITYIEQGKAGTSPLPKFSDKVIAAAKAAGMKE